MYYDDRTQPVEYIIEETPPPRAPAPRRPPPQRRRRRGCGCGGCLTGALVAGLLLVMLVVFSGVAVAGTVVYTQWSREIEAGIQQLDAARERETFETTRIMDRNGRLLWEIFGEGKRTAVPLAQMPQHLINATIAVEDDTFRENIGLDAPSLVAALVANLRNPDERPIGGSTITQQLVRHIAFDYDERTEVSYNRKTKEIVLAWLMNRRYSKDEILEMYLNEIYYGNLAYGVEAAAQTYFGKSASELNLAEATLLAGLPQSPVDLDPLTNLEAAKQRQWIVLNLMASEGHISPEVVEPTYFEPLNFVEQEVSLAAPHFAVHVRQQLEAQFGADVVANGGLQVTTTLDLDYQRLAEFLARQHVESIDPAHNLSNAALVALKPSTGEILAMLGSVDYHDNNIDGRVNVTLSPQQPGSAIKPVTYAAALSPTAQGQPPSWTAADILWDVPVDYEQADGQVYSPVNYDGRFHGPVRLRDALANSYNVPAVLVLQDIGVPRLMEFARQFGISSWGEDPQAYGLSLTLGGGEVTPLELAAAYAVFANQGYRVLPAAILRVENSAGEVLYQYEPPSPAEPVVDPRVAFLISDILDDDAARVPAMGQDNPLNLPFPAAAKTGTTNDFRDNWTVGYTPGLAVGVWTGNSDNSPMTDISGLTGAAPLWSDYMQAVYSDPELLAVLGSGEAQPPGEFFPPTGLEERPLCAIESVTIGATDCLFNDSEWLLVEPDAQPTATPPAEVVAWERVEPAVWRIPAVALPPLPEEVQVSEGQDEDEIPPQLFCHFGPNTELALLPPDAAPALFLMAPRNSESLPEAYRWAFERNLSIMPASACTEELLAMARDPNAPAVWRISSPQPGDEVSGVVPIMGTADFDPSRVQFYKVEIGVPDSGGVHWVTLGETHTTPVLRGELETLHAAAFPPGDYLLSLVVVGWDGNYVGEPYTVPIHITRQ